MGAIPYLQKPPPYILACMLSSANGLLFGMDTGVIGPVTDMKDFKSQFGGSQNATIHGLIVSSILIPAALSSFFAGYVADKLGRPKGISIGVFIFGVGAAIEAAATSLGMFIGGRVIEGLGEGLFLGNLVVYICEISPTSTRGPLTTGPQLLITLGLVVGYFTCYGTSNIASSLSWRTPWIILASLSMILSACSLMFLPPSPRWLTLHGHQDEADAAWDMLGVSHAEREKVELQVAVEEVPADNDEPENKKTHKLFEIFQKDVRGRTALAVFLMGVQQLSGIDGVLYVVRPLLFQQAGLESSEASFLASGVSALVIFAVTIPGLIYCDKWGRRHSIIYGGFGLALIMFLIGGLYAGNAVHASFGAGRWVVIVCIYIFAVIYSLTWAVSVKVYSAEIQPQRTRASATTLAHSSNWIFNFLVALVTPVLLSKSNCGAYFLFGGCSVIGAAVAAIFMIETKGRSFNEIEKEFKHRAPGRNGIFSALRRRSEKQDL
ncbi:hypothetical protein N7509_001360 [Penicillium cosmopolitanum]|uniref:Major facilitator superfamily (MFS) profile domain-containing protein n=1 Tax=Penicillium cosmopolitanum TaxID=1131564 RepID=A0A9W9WCJ9_9EURO|nr:uncharacterized protein N7509_001360 [Penicillium cosmopolitanum]KAJ5414733.1 hypothetical protein N7509_001360 [Penicillium cosmopolitanum]